ncbi:DEP domain-containing protein 1A-like isoform X1 [Rhinatrema bivittatum]|uniref:DEP domain-containing protein 1A-like isoform X1 n=1 Tax=Rhinatrema bivittatum TaxID=194408 RepID=UPI00112EDDFB|nr:DEP domain-containing protein 1A-like isoform X1 [Rhinatrema bivittatum]
MESRSITPGPYRATRLVRDGFCPAPLVPAAVLDEPRWTGGDPSCQWNEITKYFRAGMPLRKHRQHLKSYGNCFTACEAIDWLHQLLRNNSNFGPEVTRQQTIQLLRKLLKNHVIEDVKGRWGSENLDDNGQLFRFPINSPLKTVQRRHPLWGRSSNSENISKERENTVKLASFSKKTPKKHDLSVSKENIEYMKSERSDEGEQNIHCRDVSQEDVEEIWRNLILIHLQKILGLPSLEEVLDPAQINPGYIMYSMMHTSKHGVVVLQNNSDDLPHWVLSAMKCLANWPRSNDMSQPTYAGFERDVFRTVADYFLSLPEPLLTFEYYELFVNILVLCGYITVPNRYRGKRKIQDETYDPQPTKALHLSNINFFKSTECLLLSLVHKEEREENEQEDDVFPENHLKNYPPQKGCMKQIQHCNYGCKTASANDIMGGSCENLSVTSDNCISRLKCKPRYYSLEGIAENTLHFCNKDSPNIFSQSNLKISDQDKEDQSGYKSGLVPDLCSENSDRKPSSACSSRVFTRTICDPEEQTSNRLCRSQSVGDCQGINIPVAEITIKPNDIVQLEQRKLSGTSATSTVEREPADLDIALLKRFCPSTVELSENALSPASVLPTTTKSCHGTQSLLQPHLESVAIEALQLCCLLLPPPNRRKLQLLMRMIARISQNVDMPRLHDAMGTRSLMIQTFSRCVLCCAEEVDLDELLATRLVSFLMDHHQEILQVPVYLANAVQDHIEYLKKVQIKYPGAELSATLPVYSFCKQISPQEFEEQKVSTSQAAIVELLESIIKDTTLSVKDKKRKLKQFQKEYPDIYQSRFPTTESEAKLFGDKPTIKQPMLILRKPKFRSLRY